MIGTKCKGRIARIAWRSSCREIGVNEYVGWRQRWRVLTAGEQIVRFHIFWEAKLCRIAIVMIFNKICTRVY